MTKNITMNIWRQRYEIKITDFHTFYSLLLNKTNQWNYIMERIRKEIGENKYFDNFETTIFTSIL